MNFTYIQTTSLASSFKNYKNPPAFSTSVASQTLPVGNFVLAQATINMDNTNAISQVQVQYSGLETFWHVITGTVSTLYSSSTYEIQTFYSFSGSLLTVNVVVANQSAGSVVIPAITINCKAFLFLAPF